MSRDHFLSLGAIIMAMLIANLMYSVTLPLLSLTLSRAGYSETLIGLNTIAQPLAALLFAPYIPGLIGRFGAASVDRVDDQPSESETAKRSKSKRLKELKKLKQNKKRATERSS